MEMELKKDMFQELDNNEMLDVDGGGFWLCVAGVVCGWVVTKGLDHTYDYVGRKTGWW